MYLLEAVQLRENVPPFADTQQVVASGSIDDHQLAVPAATEAPAGHVDGRSENLRNLFEKPKPKEWHKKTVIVWRALKWI